MKNKNAGYAGVGPESYCGNMPGSGFGGWSSNGAILVLFILLVIISRTMLLY